MMPIHNGQPVSVTGWFVDLHGHQLYLRRSDLAPICPHRGPGPIWWRLVREVADPPDRSKP